MVTVPNTFIATTEAISQAGAIPEFVDIDEHTSNMSVELLQHYLESMHAGRIGKADQPAQRTAGHRDGAGASLRPDGGHGSDFEAGRSVRPDRD